MASPHTGGARGFSQQALDRKLSNLTSTLQSIQALAQWAIHYRKHSKTIVSVWYKEMQKGLLEAWGQSLVTESVCLHRSNR